MRHTGKAWREGKKAALSRDDHRCQDCGRYDYVHVHHIKRPEEFDDPDAGHHPTNLVTLCKWHHPKWEGLDSRPVLLDEDITVQAVVTDIVSDTVERQVHRAGSESMFKQLVLKNERACNKCFRPDDEYDSQPAAHLRSYIQTVVQSVVYGMDIDLPVRTTERGWQVNQERTEYYCPKCTLKYDYYSREASKPDLIKSAWRVSEVLAKQDIPHDGHRLQDVAETLKDKRGINDKMRYTAATACAIRAGRAEVSRPDWLIEEIDGD